MNRIMPIMKIKIFAKKCNHEKEAFRYPRKNALKSFAFVVKWPTFINQHTRRHVQYIKHNYAAEAYKKYNVAYAKLFKPLQGKL